MTSGEAKSAPAATPAVPARFDVPGEDAAAGDAAAKARGPSAPALPRKIIYNAQIQMVVESISGLADRLSRLVKDGGGYISETDISSYLHQRRQATWKVRIPVDHFDAFLADVAKLGEVQQNHIDSQDVSQEYYDIEARIANVQAEEKRLLKHLADSTGKLEDILAVEREISRVRGEIEQMQGRLRFLAHMTSLSTVTIVATEVRDYTPPVRPTFAAQIGRTFHRSVEALVEFGKAVVLFCVAIAPWLPVILLLSVGPILLVARRLKRRRPRTA